MENKYSSMALGLLPLPQLALYTKSGSIPFLSWNFIQQFGGVLYRSQNDLQNHLVRLNVGDFFDLIENNSENYQHEFNLSSMKYFENCSLFLSLVDPLKSTKIFKSTNTKIAIPTLHGKKMLSTNDMMNLAKLIGVDSVQAIADIMTPQLNQISLTSKAVARSIHFLEETIQLSNEKQEKEIKIGEKRKLELETPRLNLWATVTGGFHSENLRKSCQHICKYANEFQAIAIESFFDNQNSNIREFSNSKDSLLKVIDEIVLPYLPQNIPKSLFGVLFPDEILKFINSGIHIFDSSICTILTEKGFAFPSPLISSDPLKLRFSREMSIDSIRKESPDTIIDLNHADFAKINLVISENCQCYSCKGGFTRAYINHLLKRNELNGRMLLQMHNHFSLTEFFYRIRTMDSNEFQQLMINSELINR